MKKILIVEDSVQILAQLSYIAREINSSNKIYAFEKLEEAYRCALENDIDLFVGKRSIASTFYPPRSSAIIVSHYTQSKKFST